MSDPNYRQLVVFVCEDSARGHAFVQHCINSMRDRTPVWKGRGVTRLLETMKLAKRTYRQAKLVGLPDGDRLSREPLLRGRLRQGLLELEAMAIVIRHNVEDLAQRCLREEDQVLFTEKKKRLGKEVALSWVLEPGCARVNSRRMASQPEFLDIGDVLRCDKPTRCGL